MSDLESDAARLNDGDRGSHGGSDATIASQEVKDRLDREQQERVQRVLRGRNKNSDERSPNFEFNRCTQVQINNGVSQNIELVVKLKHLLFLIIFLLVIVLLVFTCVHLIEKRGIIIPPHSDNNSSSTGPSDKPPFINIITTAFPLKRLTNTTSEYLQTAEPVIKFDSQKNVSERFLSIIKRIIVTHTTGPSCKDNCRRRVQNLQKRNRTLNDFPIDYFIGGDGQAYNGSLYQSEQLSILNGSPSNVIGVYVAFIGTYRDSKPSKLQLETFDKLIEQLVREGKIDKDYKIFIQDQLKKMKKTANALKDAIRDKYKEKFFDGTKRRITNITNVRKMVSISVERVYERDFWEARKRCRNIGRLIGPISHVVMTEAGGFDCTDIVS